MVDTDFPDSRNDAASQVRALSATLVALQEADDAQAVLDRLANAIDEISQLNEADQQEVDLDTWALLLRQDDTVLDAMVDEDDDDKPDSIVELARFESPFRDQSVNENPLVAGSMIEIREEQPEPDSGMKVTLYFGEPRTGEPHRGKLVLCISGADQSREVDFGNFGDDDELFISGEWARPNHRQLILTLSAFGGAQEETASLAPRGQGNDLLSINGDDDQEDLELFRLDYQNARGTFVAQAGFSGNEEGLPASLDECPDPENTP